MLSESAQCSWSLIQSTRDFHVTPLKLIGLAYFARHEKVLCMSRDYTESNSVTCIHKTSAKYHYRCLGRTANNNERYSNQRGLETVYPCGTVAKEEGFTAEGYRRE